MRVVVHEYDNDKAGRTAYETSNDGGEYRGEWDGERQVGARICAFIEAACDDTEQGVDRLLKALSWLTEEIKKRKGSAASATTVK
jgi:hypothetical protein